eukprot:GFUD01084379.1.p1 GENE.GFUD01084379.1~~GFUD01084379.1.p1  ORF type:complete len:461 (+),score=113.58 GFUD01084379.1:73-1383(+)
MSRVTRNTIGAVKSNENNILVTKNSNIPLPSKRKAEDEMKKESKTRKRAALGDLTNGLSEKPIAGASNIKNQVKKGLNNIVGKGKSSLKGKDSKIFVKKVVELKEAEVKNPELGTSSSSEEGLLCTLDGSDTSNDVTVREDEKVEEKVYKIPETVRATPPDGILDFDLETLGDPQQHSEYAMETFQYYRNREAAFRIPDYMSAQMEVTDVMRAILVDWLVEVQESFELNHETLYTAVKMTDLYLSKKQVRKEDLQLVGATACLLACKVDERIAPMVDDVLYVCDDAYTRDQLMKLERKMLSVVGFDLGYSLSYRFLRRYGRVCNVTMPVLTLARYILELSLMEYSINVDISESEVAAGCLVLAFKMKGIKGYGPTLAYYSGYELKDLDTMVQRLLVLLQKPARENLKTVRSKYSHEVFHEVAMTTVPATVDLSNGD